MKIHDGNDEDPRIRIWWLIETLMNINCLAEGARERERERENGSLSRVKWANLISKVKKAFSRRSGMKADCLPAYLDGWLSSILLITDAANLSRYSRPGKPRSAKNPNTRRIIEARQPGRHTGINTNQLLAIESAAPSSLYPNR